MSVVTGRFERRNCSHPVLFKSEYKRTNRTKQTKILRCFPHCCPEHLNRSYCGASLCVRVALTSTDPLDTQQTQPSIGDSDPTRLLLYAHFEQATASFLSLHDELDHHVATSCLQTEQNPKGKWIPGAVMHDATTKRSCLFLLSPTARWYYEWESAATKAQRFTKHVLRAYIFQRLSESRLRVVGIVSSSEFMVVSYRRAPIEMQPERQPFEHVSARYTSGVQAARVTIVPEAPGFGQENQTRRLHKLDGNENAIWEERKLWECRHPDIMEASKQFAIVYYFVRFLDASAFGACLEQWGELSNEQAGRYESTARDSPDGDAQKGLAASFSWEFLGSLHQSTATRLDGERTENSADDPLSRIAHTCASLMGWIFLSSANLGLCRQFLVAYAVDLLDKTKVRTGFVEAIKLLQELANRFTGWNEQSSSSTSSSLTLLTEEILAVVFKYDHLKPLRRQFMGILSANQMFGLHEFVAQLRAQYIFQQNQVAPTRKQIAGKQPDQSSLFDGTWLFNGEHSSMSPSRDDYVLGASLGCLLEFMRELARISVRSVDDQTVELFSEWNICSLAANATAPNAQTGMSLVLDNQPRIFGSFPSGLSSSIPLGLYCFGDYRGEIISPNRFVVEMTLWPIDSATIRPTRWKLDVHIENATDRVLVMDAAVEEGWCSADVKQPPEFQTMSLNQKLQSVGAWSSIFDCKAVYNLLG